MPLLVRSFLLLHIAAGSAALLVGLIPLLGRKGGPTHRRAGRVYVGAMVVVAISAALLCIFQPLTTGRLFLSSLAIFSFYLSFSGWRAARNRAFRPADRTLALLVLAVGLAMIGLAVWLGHVLFGFFGALTCVFAGRDARFGGHETGPTPWLFRHIPRMGGSYISATTALLAVNMGHWLPAGTPGWVYTLGWMAPSIVGGVLIGRTLRRYRAKSAGRKAIIHPQPTA